ncbi:hypothetical protein HEAR0646 [Herminiimonas arsenicoxydans]|uniref:Uncharacterized protein n=1 Tax=Herminiimonas arsenicoxydans TaxID=204773 RepID=A4G2V6_HERAR|nr:hypothetical protein HEAR0646 [Herminiimonas arsenicoxydans]
MAQKNLQTQGMGSHVCTRPPDSAVPGSMNNTGKILATAIEDEACEVDKMHPKFRHPAIEGGNMAAVAEFDEQSMYPKYTQSRSSAGWKWPPNGLPP